MKKSLLLTTILGSAILAPSALHAQFTYTTNNGTVAITGYTGPDGDVIIPGTLDGFPVASIGDSAFKGRGVISVTIPDSVTRIGKSAFSSCHSLSNVVMPESASIGDWAFARCYSLTEITIPGSVTRIGEGMFAWCIGLTNITLSDSVTSIDDWAFFGCARLAEVALGNSVTEIEDWAFSQCYSLTSITIPDSVTRIGEYAFSSCYSLTNVIVGNGVTSIEDRAFVYCYNLISVTIGESVTSLGDWAFFLCAGLEGIFFKGDAPEFLSSGVFGGADNATIYYLPGTAGWGPTFDGLPTAPWPLAEPVMLNPGVQTNGFGFMISWATNTAVVVEASASVNGSAWSPVATNTLSGGSVFFSDPGWRDSPTRFYRVRPQF
jgi:hypothetical protein